MKAIVKTAHGVGNIEIMDVKEPVCGRDEVKIEIKYTGICGTDLHLYYDTFSCNPPVIMGHEMCGVVCEVGSDVKTIKVGDRVTAENVCISCGTCEMCQSGHYAICPSRAAQGSGIDGGFCKYVVCKEKFVFKIPDNCSYEEGALIEPLVCCVHGVLEQSDIKDGDIVLVSGAGAIGILCAQLAKISGGYVILTDIIDERLEKAKEIGIDKTVNVKKESIEDIVNELTGGTGVNVVLECSGSEAAVDTDVSMLKKLGSFTNVSLFDDSIKFDINKFIWKEVRFNFALSHTITAWEKALRLVEQKKIKLMPLVTAKYPITEWNRAFDDFRNKRGLKTLLYPID